MDAIQLLLRDHARTHARGVGEPEGGIAIGGFAFHGVDEGQMRQRPGDGLNSLAWLLWHMARTEDMAVNLLIAGRPQVLEEGGWAERLGIDRRDIATGMTDDEVGDFSDRVDLTALREYRDAVGRRSVEVVASIQSEALDEVIDATMVRRTFDEEIISATAGWLDGFMSGKTKAFILGHTMNAHNFMHIGEAFCLRSMLGLRVPV